MKYAYLVLLFSSQLIFARAQNKVAIIGGGIAGVSAAHYLHKFDPNASITIFEKEKLLGGNAQTAEVTTSDGRKVKVDVGPQYFAKGPWDDYIAFLDETLGWKNVNVETFDASLVIHQSDNNHTHLATPLNGKFRGEKLGNLLRLKSFNSAAYQVYKNPSEWKLKTIEHWVEQLKFDLSYKNEVIYPFLAAALGTSVQEIKQTAAVEIISLFAFRKPKMSNKFHIMKDGMGYLIQEVGQLLIDCGVSIKTESPVRSISKEKDGWLLSYNNANLVYKDYFDFVIFAVHADVAANLTKDEPVLQNMNLILNDFPYFQAQIVIHEDTNFIQNNKPAFLNIFTTDKNELEYSTMNLSMISDRTKGIYKSWLSKEMINKLQENDAILHQQTFYHPMITTAFIKSLELLKTEVLKQPQMEIIGGWTEGLETQNSAIISAQRAVNSYKKFLQLTK